MIFNNMYFDKEDRQYRSNLIINPPEYTVQEINKVISLLPSRKVCDFGAGTGRLTIPLLKSGMTVIAVDISRDSIKKLKQLCLNENLGKVKTQSEIPNKTNVAGCDVLHHIDINKYFPIFYEKLDSDKVIVFSEPNGWNLFWYALIFTRLDWNEEKGITQINFFNLISALKKAGFKKIKITGMGILPGPFCLGNRLLCRINYALGNLPIIKLFAYRLLILARKD